MLMATFVEIAIDDLASAEVGRYSRLLPDDGLILLLCTLTVNVPPTQYLAPHYLQDTIFFWNPTI
jgi:hypothetical protein